MNTPNKLTILRILLVPFFVIFLLWDKIPLNYLWALLTFAAASATDALDGYLARKNNQITTFGKFLDPVADKVLVTAVLICFIPLGLANAVAVLIIIAREFMVMSLRLVAVSGEGRVIAAGKLGKLKTAFTMVAIVVVLLLLGASELFRLPQGLDIGFISNLLVWISAVITVVSGIEYIIVNRSVINASK